MVKDEMFAEAVSLISDALSAVYEDNIVLIPSIIFSSFGKKLELELLK